MRCIYAIRYATHKHQRSRDWVFIAALFLFLFSYLLFFLLLFTLSPVMVLPCVLLTTFHSQLDLSYMHSPSAFGIVHMLYFTRFYAHAQLQQMLMNYTHWTSIKTSFQHLSIIGKLLGVISCYCYCRFFSVMPIEMRTFQYIHVFLAPVFTQCMQFSF